MAPLRRILLALVLALSVAGLAACGDGEDRPGQVTSEDGSGSGSVSGTGTGSVSATGGEVTASASGEGGHGHAQAAFTEKDASDVVELELKDYAFVGMPAQVTGPKVFFKGRNTGSAEHEMEVFDQNGREIGGVEGIAKGESDTLAVELEPGTYTIECHVKEGDKTHAELGMKTPFVVAAG